jgi:endoglucanase
VKRLAWISVLVVVAAASAAAAPASPAVFHKGVNLTGWLQGADAGSIVPGEYTEQDFRDIRALGCDVIRLPINLNRMARTSGDGKVPRRLFDALDQAVTWATRNDLSLILDNHTQEDDQSIDPGFGDVLPVVWKQVAQHFRSSPAALIYEIFNEPHDITAAAWDRIQRRTLAAIRSVDTVHTVVVTGTDWGGIDGLLALKPYDDPLLIYSFHFYDPFAFTHQGAEWADQAGLTRVPFPPDPSRPPVVMPGATASQLKQTADWYMASDPVKEMTALLDKASAWGQKNHVPLYCGELGVYDKVSPVADRVRWYSLVRSLLEKRCIPFTTWDYRDGFGLYTPGSAEDFDHDLNVPLLQALGFTAPVQTPRNPVSAAGFPIYTGGLARGIRSDFYSNGGRVDYPDPVSGSVGTNSVRLTGGEQYGALGFTFASVRDLRLLAAGRGALHLWVRLRGKPVPFDVRFLMPFDAAGGSLPWRMTITVSPVDAPWDGQWHELLFPLSRFEETGAWDGAWHEPQGLSSWAHVAGLQIVAEHADLEGREITVDGVEVRGP